MDDNQESSFLERQNQAIKAIFWRSNFLIPVTSTSIGGMEVSTPCINDILVKQGDNKKKKIVSKWHALDLLLADI